MKLPKLLIGLLAAYAILFAWSTRHMSSPERAPFSIRLITGNIIEVLKSGVPLLFALCFMSYAMMFLAFIGFLPTIFIAEAGLKPAVAAMLSALVLAMNIPGNLAGGFLLSRGVPRWRLIFIAVVTMPIASVGVYASGLPLAMRLISALIFCGVGGILPVTAFDGTAHHAPRVALVGTATGLLVQGTQVGMLIGPPFVAKAVTYFGSWNYLPWAFALFSLLGAASALAIRHAELRLKTGAHPDRL
jgi:predicted MFS family arabinose efflux permease